MQYGKQKPLVDTRLCLLGSAFGAPRYARSLLLDQNPNLFLRTLRPDMPARIPQHPPTPSTAPLPMARHVWGCARTARALGSGGDLITHAPLGEQKSVVFLRTLCHHMPERILQVQASCNILDRRTGPCLACTGVRAARMRRVRSGARSALRQAGASLCTHPHGKQNLRLFLRTLSRHACKDPPTSFTSLTGPLAMARHVLGRAWWRALAPGGHLLMRALL